MQVRELEADERHRLQEDREAAQNKRHAEQEDRGHTAATGARTVLPRHFQFACVWVVLLSIGNLTVLLIVFVVVFLLSLCNSSQNFPISAESCIFLSLRRFSLVYGLLGDGRESIF